VGLNYHSTGNNIDITTAQINKGSGCNLLLERLNIDASHALFIFNDFNDLPLINAVPDIIKLKVGTLMPEVSADYYAATPHDVAEILRQLL
jgi:hydroxymethylpyrimidine pyrophosphatase-like HAD family hydrolase